MAKPRNNNNYFTLADAEILHGLVRDFGVKEAKYKLEFLQKIQRSVPENAEALLSCHEALLFLCAYPDSVEMQRMAEKELKRIGEIASDIFPNANKKELKFLEGTGLNGTTITARFSWGLTDHLASKYPQNITLYSMEGDEVRLREIIQQSVSDYEQETIPVGLTEITEWMENEALTSGKSSLIVLMECLRKLNITNKLRAHIFENLQIFIQINFGALMAQRSEIKLKKHKSYWQKTSLRKKVSASEIVHKNTIPQIADFDADDLLQTARLSLLSLCKETDPITYAQPGDFCLYNMGEGLQIALFHMQPAFRLPLEIYAGYMAFRNGIPYSYGGAWCFEKTALIGINIYETFRGGESAMMLCQLMRLYHCIYGIDHFRVEPYQLGHDNADGLHSGVFWFYYRLGFRPEEEKLKTLAATEWQKIQTNHAYRTPISVLRRLVKGYMAYFTDDHFIHTDPAAIGPWITENIRNKFQGNREKALYAAKKHAMKTLQITEREWNKWPVAEQNSFQQFSLVLFCLNGWGNWNKSEKASLVKMMRAKGSDKEKPFLDLWQKNKKLQDLLRTELQVIN